MRPRTRYVPASGTLSANHPRATGSCLTADWLHGTSSAYRPGPVGCQSWAVMRDARPASGSTCNRTYPSNDGSSDSHQP